METRHLKLSPSRIVSTVFVCCFGSALLLVLADAVFTFGNLVDSGAIRRLFNITREDSLPNWFSVLLWTLIAFSAAAISLLSVGRDRRVWGAVAVFFGYLSLDDGSKLHERLGSFTKELMQSSSVLGSPDLGPIDPLTGQPFGIDPEAGLEAAYGFSSYGWHIWVSPLIGLLGFVFFYVIVRRLSSKRSKLLLFAGFSLLAIAIVMDYFEGNQLFIDQLTFKLGLRDSYPLLHFLKSAEEFLEMIGMSLILSAFLRQLFDSFSELSVSKLEDLP